jgi:mRNA interferase HicA
VNSSELKRYLKKRGCTFAPAKGGHLVVYLGNRKTFMPVHGSRKEIGTGLVNKIKKDLGLE